MSGLSVYIETSIPSYITARTSRDIVTAGRQAISRDWWDLRKDEFMLFVSPYVLDEVSQGDRFAAKMRLELLESIPILNVDDEVNHLVEWILSAKIIPEKAILDAAHIAIATRYELDFLLTWNCRHIANIENLRLLQDIMKNQGYKMPFVCTPDELMGSDYYDRPNY